MSADDAVGYSFAFLLLTLSIYGIIFIGFFIWKEVLKK